VEGFGFFLEVIFLSKRANGMREQNQNEKA
jgi:hypothetical protein